MVCGSMAAAHLVHCHARPVHVFVFVLATYRLVVGLPTSSNTVDQLSRQQIRLAMLHPDPSDVVEQFVLRHFDVPNRTLLPDYDVVVHHYRARRGESVHQLIAVLAEDTPTYHALLGPWYREDAEDLIHLAPRARLFQVHGGNNIAFRDRTTYPYHFRAVRSMQGVQTTFFEIAMRNEWYSIISLWGVQDFVDGSTALAASLNMKNFPTLVEPVAPAWAVSAWQDNIINLVRSFRVRIVIVFIGLEQGRPEEKRLPDAFVKRSWTKACEDCGTAGALPLIASGVLAVAFVVVATLVINKDIHKTPAASMMIVGVTSLLFTSLQAMGVFSTVEVPWKEPIKRMLELSKVLSFDFDLLKVACVLGEQPLRSFAFRQLVAVVMVPFVAVALLLKKYIFGKRRTDILVELCNSIGTIYSVFFISIVISAVDPFMCYDHPNGNGESVQSAPSMLCFQGGGNHAAMVAIGLVGVLLVPLPFMCFCAYGIWTYPRMIKKHSSSRFLHATRFLFLRFVPHRYYFQLVVLARSVLMCLIPAALRGEAASQIILISMVLCGYEVLVYSLLPWRVVHCNHLDAILTQLLVLFLLCGGIFIKETPQESTVGVLSMVVFIGIITSVTIALAYAVRQRLAPSCYQFFICHHKAHAAAQSRYLKILLKKRRSNTRVFIDSDNLQELDSLFDVVKSRVKHLLVLLTADTLKRPWCVGEIVTALKGGLQVTRLETPSFVVPTEEQQASADAYVDSTGCNLSEYGIQWADVTDALAAFLGSAAAQLRLSEVLPGTRRFEHAVASVLKQRNDDQTKVKLLSNVGVGSVLVVTNPESDEANASGGILVDHIAAEVYRICEQGLVLLCDYDHDLDSSLRVAGQSSVAVVILSEGCLQSVTHLGIICHLMQAQVRESSSAIISVNTPGFGFPTLATIDQACKASPALKASYGDNATQYVSSFFKRISIYLPTHAGQHALAAQSEEILRRIQDCLANKLGKAFHQTSQESSSRHMLEAESKRSGAPISSSSPTTDSHTTDLHNQKKKADPPPVRASRYTWTLEFPAEDISEKDF